MKEHKVNKLANYNERLRAINGTLLLVGFAVLAICGLYMLVSWISHSLSRGDRAATGITIESDTISDGLKKQIVRDQAISLSGPKLLDSARALYMIPVALTNLERPENVGLQEYADVYDSGEYSGRSQGYSSGGYNNLVLYEQRGGQKYQLFNQRTAIDEVAYVDSPTGNFLLIEASRNDSNKDGKLNRADLAGFSVYSIVEHRLYNFDFEHMGVHSFKYLENTETVVLRLRVDKNHNGELDADAEPIVMKELNLATMQMRDFIEPDMMEAMQGLID